MPRKARQKREIRQITQPEEQISKKLKIVNTEKSNSTALNAWGSWLDAKNEEIPEFLETTDEQKVKYVPLFLNEVTKTGKNTAGQELKSKTLQLYFTSLNRLWENHQIDQKVDSKDLKSLWSINGSSLKIAQHNRMAVQSIC